MPQFTDKLNWDTLISGFGFVMKDAAWASCGCFQGKMELNRGLHFNCCEESVEREIERRFGFKKKIERRLKKKRDRERERDRLGKLIIQLSSF